PPPLIICTPGVRSGKPCVVGTRITVSDVLEYLASGMSQDEILSDFPDLRPEHLQAVLRYAAGIYHRTNHLLAHAPQGLTIALPPAAIADAAQAQGCRWPRSDRHCVRHLPPFSSGLQQPPGDISGAHSK
ncbi:MAG: DUF433 domain-containing protein, partial [Cyanobium sp.]